MEDWEREGVELLSPLRDRIEPETSSDALVAKSLARVKESITASELVEFGTAVLVCEFLGPVLDLFAFALGFPAAEVAAAREQ